MPNYQQPFGRAGEVVGGTAGGAAGAAGGGLLGFLGDILSPLDYPRQALWNLVKGTGSALSGEGTWDDALGAIPGALGGLLTGGLMASGVGAPLGILAGSALGGAAQGIGKGTGKEAFNAPSVEDLTGTDEFLPNLLVSALTDPLTYAGGIGGAKKGAAVGRSAGESFGQGLEQAALQRGPRYPGGAEKLKDVMLSPNISGMQYDEAKTALQHLENAMKNPDLLGEIMPGSQYLGHGKETVALRRPDGGVTLIQRPSEVIRDLGHNIDMAKPPPTRLDIPEMLQASRSKAFEGANPTRVEQVPMLDVVYPHQRPGEAGAAYKERFMEEFLPRDDQAKLLQDALAKRGVNFWDAHGGNVGVDATGATKITDAGAVKGQAHIPEMIPPPGVDLSYLVDDAGKVMSVPLPRAAEAPTGQPGRLQNLLLSLLGSDESVRREIAEQLAKQNVTRPMGTPALAVPPRPGSAIFGDLPPMSPTVKGLPPKAVDISPTVKGPGEDRFAKFVADPAAAARAEWEKKLRDAGLR